MELKHIKELMAAMGRTGMKSVSIKKDGFELVLEKENNGQKNTDHSFDLAEESSKFFADWNKADLSLPRSTETPVRPVATPSVSSTLKEDEKRNYITSPMVGTMYLAPSPDDASFVKVGDRVEKNTVVCIIEAMKVMNEIKANASGVITEVLVESGHPVEFGSKLFRIIE